MRIAVSIAMLAGCGPGTLVFTATMTITTVSGTGPSPLDPLDGQQVALTVTLEHPATSHMTIDSCHDAVASKVEPTRTATGATGPLVTDQVLGLLPEWQARLELCDPAAASRVILQSDNEHGLALSIGCVQLPRSAYEYDGDAPAWTSFSSTACDVTLYDQLHGRLFAGTAIELTIEN